MPVIPFRQIHMDYHTAGDIPDVAARFDAEAFAATLEKARVNSVTCFARCHHGYLYYRSNKFPERIHPHLRNKDLLREQIEACHARGIRVPIYITVQWDHYTAQRHPEWCVLDANGKLDGTAPYEPGFYRFLCINSPYRDFLKEHTREVLETMPVDGIFFDILFIRDCSCWHCRSGMEKNGMDASDPKQRLAYAHNLMKEFVRDMSSFVRQFNQRCTIYYNTANIRPGYRDHTDAFTHLEFDVLPSQSKGGYIHFSHRARFERNLGLECMGMTGKFHRGWGDMHTLKNQAALEYECFQLLALNCKCSVGDQLHPSGRIEEETYKLVGNVFRQVERKEPWCRDARAVCDIGVLAVEEFGGDSSHMRGAARMLSEGAHQFDILDSAMDFTRYKMLILPDQIQVSEELAMKIGKYLDGGGRLIASCESGLNPEKSRFVLPQLGVVLRGDGPIAPDGKPARGRLIKNHCEIAYADYILPRAAIAGTLPRIEYNMYTKCAKVDAGAKTEVLADVVLPYYYRTYKHFCSHLQAPSSGKINSAGIVRNGQVIYFAHAIFEIYYECAPAWVKRLFLNAIDLLLPEPLVRHNGPSALDVVINEQNAENRRIIHLLYYVPECRANRLEIIEDVIPLYNIKVSIRVDKAVKKIRCVPDGEALSFFEKNGRIEFTVPEVHGHQMVELIF